jgi:hypothetical protein
MQKVHADHDDSKPRDGLLFLNPLSSNSPQCADAESNAKSYEAVRALTRIIKAKKAVAES